MTTYLKVKVRPCGHWVRTLEPEIRPFVSEIRLKVPYYCTTCGVEVFADEIMDAVHEEMEVSIDPAPQIDLARLLS